MIKINAEQFWPLYRDEIRRTGNLEVLRNNTAWTCTVINAAKSICKNAGLKTGNELYLDVMGYEQRQPSVNYNWDLRVAFEHENSRNWHDELCKLCHVVADLRVLVAYFSKKENIHEKLQERIDIMGERMTHVPNVEWLFIFGPDKSEKDDRPWIAFTLDQRRQLRSQPDHRPFNPYKEFSKRR